MRVEHDPYAALRHGDYRLFLSGAVLSSVGGEMLAVAVGWEIWGRTNSQLMLGLTGLAQFLPVLLLALPAGQAADRYSRKRLLQGAQLLMAAAAVGLAVISWQQLPVGLMFACLVLAGCSRAMTMPARHSLVPQLVPAADLPSAVTWNSSGWQGASVAGPALGGLVVAVLPQGAAYAAAYLFAAGCSLAYVLLLAPVRPRETPRPAEPRSLRSLLAGVGFVWRTQLLLAAITLDLFAVLLGGATALLPVYADTILHVGPTGLGVLRAAPAAGALVMAMVLAHRRPLRRPGQALLLSVAGFGLATVVFGLSRNLLLSFCMLALAGALDNVSVVVRGTLAQLLTPDSMRGRVSAVNSVFITSSNQLGEFESGVTAFWFGTVASVVMGGVGTIGVVVVVMLLWPQLLRLGTLHAGMAAAEEDRLKAETA
jgi:MFS family permease